MLPLMGYSKEQLKEIAIDEYRYYVDGKKKATNLSNDHALTVYCSDLKRFIDEASRLLCVDSSNYYKKELQDKLDNTLQKLGKNETRKDFLSSVDLLYSQSLQAADFVAEVILRDFAISVFDDYFLAMQKNNLKGEYYGIYKCILLLMFIYDHQYDALQEFENMWWRKISEDHSNLSHGVAERVAKLVQRAGSFKTSDWANIFEKINRDFADYGIETLKDEQDCFDWQSALEVGKDKSRTAIILRDIGANINSNLIYLIKLAIDLNKVICKDMKHYSYNWLRFMDIIIDKAQVAVI